MIVRRGMGQTAYITPEQAMGVVSWFPWLLLGVVFAMVAIKQRGH